MNRAATKTHPSGERGRIVLTATLLLSLMLATPDAPVLAQQADNGVAVPGMTWDPNDPRIGLAAGWQDAEQAILNLELLTSVHRPEGFMNPETPGDGRFSNTDLAFQGDLLFQGNYNGFQIFDISDPSSPRLEVAVVCPGGRVTSPCPETSWSCRPRRAGAGSTAEWAVWRKP